MSEECQRIRPHLVRKLKSELDPPKAWKMIARECHVHPGTLKRWLAGERMRMDNIVLLAKALRTTADKIILPDGKEDWTDYVDAEVIIDEASDKHKQPDDIGKLLEDFQLKVGPKYKVLLMYVGEGSIKIILRLHGKDAVRLIKSFVKNELSDMKAQSVLIKQADFSTQAPASLLDMGENIFELCELLDALKSYPIESPSRRKLYKSLARINYGRK